METDPRSAVKRCPIVKPLASFAYQRSSA